VKRIEACCAQSALNRVQKNAQQLKEIAVFLGVEEDKILQKLEQGNKKKSQSAAEIEVKTVKNLKVGWVVAPDVDLEVQMKAFGLDLLLVCAAKEDKIGLQLKILSPEKSGLDAKGILQELGQLIEARGCGGRRDFAQTGGIFVPNFSILYKKFVEILEKNLN